MNNYLVMIQRTRYIIINQIRKHIIIKYTLLTILSQNIYEVATGKGCFKLFHAQSLQWRQCHIFIADLEDPRYKMIAWREVGHFLAYKILYHFIELVGHQ